MVHSPSPSSSAFFARPSGDKRPRELAGRPPLAMADWKLGVDGRPKVGEETRLVVEEPYIMEPGRAMRDAGRPPGGSGEEERGGGFEPEYFFCVSVKEKIA